MFAPPSTVGGDRIWRAQLRIQIANRIAKAAPAGRVGNVTNEGTEEVYTNLADCIALDIARYKSYAWGGAEIETPKREPETTTCPISPANQNILLFAILYGVEHKREMRQDLEKLIWRRERKPALFTAHFPVVRWNRLCYEYTETVREGVRTMIRLLPDGANRAAFVFSALSPFKNSRKRLWRRPDVLPFSPSSGMRRGSILPEIDERLESDRTNGSAFLRPAPHIGESTPILAGQGEKRNVNRTQTGGPKKESPSIPP